MTLVSLPDPKPRVTSFHAAETSLTQYYTSRVVYDFTIHTSRQRKFYQFLAMIHCVSLTDSRLLSLLSAPLSYLLVLLRCALVMYHNLGYHNAPPGEW